MFNTTADVSDYCASAGAVCVCVCECVRVCEKEREKRRKKKGTGARGSRDLAAASTLQQETLQSAFNHWVPSSTHTQGRREIEGGKEKEKEERE